MQDKTSSGLRTGIRLDNLLRSLLTLTSRLESDLDYFARTFGNPVIPELSISHKVMLPGITTLPLSQA